MRKAWNKQKCLTYLSSNIPLRGFSRKYDSDPTFLTKIKEKNAMRQWAIK